LNFKINTAECVEKQDKKDNGYVGLSKQD